MVTCLPARHQPRPQFPFRGYNTPVEPLQVPRSTRVRAPDGVGGICGGGAWWRLNRRAQAAARAQVRQPTYYVSCSIAWGIWSVVYTHFLEGVGGMSSSRAASISTFQWLAYAIAQVLSNPVLGTLSDTRSADGRCCCSARRSSACCSWPTATRARALVGARRRHHGFLRRDVVDLQRTRSSLTTSRTASSPAAQTTTAKSPAIQVALQSSRSTAIAQFS